MDWRALIRIATPLMLTFILVGVEAYGVSVPVRRGVLVAMTLAWLVYAWTPLRPSASLLRREQTRLLHELHCFIDAEAQSLRTEIERTRELLRESVRTLGDSFETVSRRSRRQGEVVAQPIGRKGGCDNSDGTRAEAAAMGERVASINHGNGMREIAECGRAIDDSLVDAVRSLQFEDIAAQSLTAASAHLQRLDAINREAATLQELLYRSGGQGDAERRHALHQLGQRITLMRGEWERPPHKPARQQSMDAGSVELF